MSITEKEHNHQLTGQRLTVAENPHRRAVGRGPIGPATVTSVDGTCAVRGCPLFGSGWHETRLGSFVIAYCEQHRKLADRVFHPPPAGAPGVPPAGPQGADEGRGR